MRREYLLADQVLRHFRLKKEAGDHKLKIGTIFSYGVNEDDPDADGSYMFEELESVTGLDQVSPHSEGLAFQNRGPH